MNFRLFAEASLVGTIMYVNSVPNHKVKNQNNQDHEVRQKLYWKDDEILLIKTQLVSLITDEQSFQEMFLLDKVCTV